MRVRILPSASGTAKPPSYRNYFDKRKLFAEEYAKWTAGRRKELDNLTFNLETDSFEWPAIRVAGIERAWVQINKIVYEVSLRQNCIVSCDNNGCPKLNWNLTLSGTLKKRTGTWFDSSASIEVDNQTGRKFRKPL